MELRKKFESNSKKPGLINVDTITARSLFSASRYTGRFMNAGYGELEIAAFKKALLLTYYSLKLVLIPKGGHRFSSHHWWEDEDGVSVDGVGDVLFNFNKSGALQSFQIPFEPSVKDIIFRKK